MSKTWLQIRDGKVVNRIEWDGSTETWQPDGTMIADRSGVQAGDIYDDKTDSFAQSVEPPIPESFTLSQIIAALDAVGFTILETDDRLVNALNAVGKTIDDLKAAIEGGQKIAKRT